MAISWTRSVRCTAPQRYPKPAHSASVRGRGLADLVALLLQDGSEQASELGIVLGEDDERMAPGRSVGSRDHVRGSCMSRSRADLAREAAGTALPATRAGRFATPLGRRAVS